MDLNKLYDKLPDEILSIVKSYIRPSSLIFLNNNYYNKYHYLIKYLIPKNQFENYIRNIIRRDYDFVFQQILHDNFIKWLNIKQYIYKNIMYKNYLYF